MAAIPVQWGEWRPDLATLDTQFAQDVENVFPGSNSYMPIPDLRPTTAQVVPPPPAVKSPIVGMFSARNRNGDWIIFAGTHSNLYKFENGVWNDVTRTTGGTYTVPPDNLWSFTQFGNWVIAVNINNEPQALDIDVPSGTFANLGGNPPKAYNVHTIGDFVVLAGLADGNNLIQWSGINDTTSWTIGLNLSDMQEFADGGPVMGVAGDKIGYVLQDRAIRLMQFLPGDTSYIFSFSKVVYDRGSLGRYCFATIGDVLYMLCEDGFYSLAGSQLLPIGFEKVNEWFLANSDANRRNLVQCITSVRPYLIWPYHTSPGSPVGNYDAVLIFNWMNQRWSRGRVEAQMWATVATLGLDLDTTGDEPGDDLLDSTAKELDNFAYIGGRPQIAAINPAGLLCNLSGPNLQATLESPEVHLVPSQRAMVGDVYPIADSAEGVIYNGYRERLQDTVAWTEAYPIEITGSAAVYNSSRLHRFRHVLPSGSRWTHAQGVLADAQQDGTVA